MKPAEKEKSERLDHAIAVAKKAHEGQFRKTGEPYITHPLAVKKILEEWGMDEDTIIAGILHDTVEDTPLTLNDIKKEFGESVAFLVDGVTKLQHLHLADILIRIHANGSEAQYVQGASTICCTKNNPYYAKASYGKSRKLSKRILNGIIEKTGCKNCGIEETDTMTGINWCEIPSTIVEVGYMSNLKEDRLLATKTYQNKLVKGMAEGIENYFGF